MDSADMQRQILAIEAEFRATHSSKQFKNDAERTAFESIKARADHTFQACRKTLFDPGAESLEQYRLRLMQVLQSETSLARTDISGVINDPAALDRMEARVMREAMASAHNADDLRPIVTTDRTGRQITEYVGSSRAWMDQLKAPALCSPVYLNDQPQIAPVIVR